MQQKKWSAADLPVLYAASRSSRFSQASNLAAEVAVGTLMSNGITAMGQTDAGWIDLPGLGTGARFPEI